MMGSLEAWLLLRSLRTLHLRVPRQSETATKLAQWLYPASKGKAVEGIPAGVIETVWHSSLQGKDARGWEPSKQMKGGWNATFAILVSIPIDSHVKNHIAQVLGLQLTKQEYASLLPHRLKFFIVSFFNSYSPRTVMNDLRSPQQVLEE